MSPPTDRAARRRAEILAAAQRVFLAKGFHEAGIADIAAELGMGHGTFYRYFKNKRDIAEAVLEQVIGKLAEAGLSEDPEASETLEEYRAQVRRILTRLVAVSAAHPTLLGFFQQQGLVIDAQRLRRFHDEFAAFTARFLVNGIDRGFLHPELDVEPTSEALVAMTFEGLTRAMTARDPEVAVRWMEAGMRLMFDGIRR